MRNGLTLTLLLSSNLFAAPAIQHWETANGAKVFFTPAREIPIVDVRVVFDAGSARDGDKAGLASITNSLLSEGAGKLDADSIAKRFDSMGSKLGNGALRDMAWLSVRALSDEQVLRDTIGLASLVLKSPTFPKKSFERQRKSMQVNLQAKKQNPSSIAEEAFMSALYGDHPYASPPQGTEESLEKLNLEDVRTFYQQYYVASNAVLAIVGDLSRLKAEALAEVITSDLPSGSRAQALPEVKAIQHQRVDIKHPSTQSHVWVGQPGMKRTDKDYYALYVGNHALGGSGLVSLLSNEVREKRGFAYSVYSYFIPMREAGPFRMALQTKNEHTHKALKVMRETAKRYVTDGITQEQLIASKKNITGGFALRLDSNKKLAENLSMIGFYGLPLNYLSNFNSKIEAVTVDDVKDAMLRRLDLDNLITVVVGPGSGQISVMPADKEK